MESEAPGVLKLQASFPLVNREYGMASRYAPQGIIDAAAFMVASHMASADWSDAVMENYLAALGKRYRQSFRGDEQFEDDVRHCAVYANGAATRAYAQPARRAEVLRLCYEIVREVEPDGSRRKKFLGFFGGTLFSGSHQHPAHRKVLFEQNFLPYMAMAIKVDLGTIRTPTDTQQSAR